MGTFTKEELAKLKANGNDVAASKWRAGCDEALPTDKSRAKVKAFMEKTYVQKKWYSGGDAPKRSKSVTAPPAVTKTKSSKKSSKKAPEPAEDDEESEEEEDSESEEAPPVSRKASKKQRAKTVASALYLCC